MKLRARSPCRFETVQVNWRTAPEGGRAHSPGAGRSRWIVWLWLRLGFWVIILRKLVEIFGAEKKGVRRFVGGKGIDRLRRGGAGGGSWRG